MTPDSELLRQFARTNSEAAFGELVKRHVNLVYSAALRQVNGDGHLAQDVAQTVFTDLARKAASLAHGRDASSPLTGWLYTAAHHAAAKMIRGENRRRGREEKFMRESISETAPDADWEKLRPMLDDAMHELKEADREAILLRYFENRQFAEVGAKLGLNENAARMRVDRALEKLRAIFAKHGITTAGALASVISANAVQMAPVNLAATLTTASIATAGTGTFTLLKIMTATKLKLGISALFVAGATTAFVIQHQTQEKLRADNEAMAQQMEQLQADDESLSNRLAEAGEVKLLPQEQFNELLKLRGEVGVLRRQTNKIGKLEKEISRLQTQAQNQQTNQLSAEDKFQLTQLHFGTAMSAIAIAVKGYMESHNGQYPTSFDQLNLSTNTFASDVGLNDFEFVNSVGPQGEKLILRARMPIQNPDGNWVWIYGGTNANTETFNSADGNAGPIQNQ